MSTQKVNITVDDLIEATAQLSDEDKKEFIRRLGVEPKEESTAGVLVYDESVDTQADPIIPIEYPDGTKELIDIIAVVQRDPCNIGHPVIVKCIWYWLSLIESGAWEGRDREIGLKNMKKLTDALWEGAESSIPPSHEVVRCINYIKLPTACPNKINHAPLPLRIVYRAFDLLQDSPDLRADRNGQRKDHLLLSKLASNSHKYRRVLHGRELDKHINETLTCCDHHRIEMSTIVKICRFVGLTREDIRDEKKVIVNAKGKPIEDLLNYQAAINGKSFNNFLEYYIAYTEGMSASTAHSYLARARKYFVDHSNSSFIRHITSHLEEDGYYEFSDNCHPDNFIVRSSEVSFPIDKKPWID